MRVPKVVTEFAAPFREAGFQCHLVGGAVRDILLGRPLTDFDIATNARPEQVKGLFRRVIPTGIRHGTVTVLFTGSGAAATTFEVTTFRTEAGYTDGRHPDAVAFASTIEEDLSRRDFTINAMAWDLLEKRMRDPHEGQRDLARRLIRAIGSASERFGEDGLRPLRACRFAAQLSFDVEQATRDAIRGALPVLAGVSAERVHDELVKVLAAPRPSVGLVLMKETGILGLILPELLEGDGVAQGELHCHDVLTHAFAACDAAPPESPVLRLAALFHDIGKPRCRGTGPGGRPTFHGHETVSTAMAAAIMERLRFPTAVTKQVCHLVSNHMFNYQEEWTDAAVRRLIARVGEDSLADLLALRRADQVGMCRENAGVFPAGLARLTERIDAVREQGRVFTLARLAVNGRDLMQALGVPPGPHLGTILDELLQAVLEDPAQNERGLLLEMAARLYRERISPGGKGPGNGGSASA